ncbi:hypothetical protein BCH_00394 [Brucella sp. 191011898]|nr:hypothetical protein BCH_00394 [Brucella sp. 191011898]
MQTDAEHQQDDADFGKLENKALIGHEARRVRACNDTGQKIADKGRDFQPGGYRTKDKGKA